MTASNVGIVLAVVSAACLALPPGSLQADPPGESGAAPAYLPAAAAASPPPQAIAAPQAMIAPQGTAATGPVLPPQGVAMVAAGPSLAAAGDMIGFSREIAGGSQAITLINASRRWMTVYHIDQAGLIRLVSSRPLDGDFSFQFNATAPLPEEIRRLQGN